MFVKPSRSSVLASPRARNFILSVPLETRALRKTRVSELSVSESDADLSFFFFSSSFFFFFFLLLPDDLSLASDVEDDEPLPSFLLARAAIMSSTDFFSLLVVASSPGSAAPAAEWPRRQLASTPTSQDCCRARSSSAHR